MAKAKRLGGSGGVAVQPAAGADAPMPGSRPAAPANGVVCADLPLAPLQFDGSLGVGVLSRTEWLLTNGMGGFAMGTASGVPTRRYHGLLIGATMPPVGRVMALSAMSETIVVDPGTAGERRIELSTFAFKGAEYQPAVLHPDGASRLVRFEKDLTCRWIFESEVVPGERVRVSKELCLHERVNSCSLRYIVERLGKGAGTSSLHLHVRPLVGLRDMHALNGPGGEGRYAHVHGATDCRVERDGRELRLISDNAVFAPATETWRNFFYRIEQERAQDCYEDLWSPGYFLLSVPTGERAARCVVQASLGERGDPEPSFLEIGASVSLRRARLGKQFGAARGEKTLSPSEERTLAALVCAADDFVVARSASRGGANGRPTDCTALTQVSVIAGYPWFGDWGRDTCISLPGLMIATGRLDDARRTLTAFAKARKDGIIPNLFIDQTGHAEYNTVDASLWFIHAACDYQKASGDRAVFEADLLPACLEIIGAYRRGTAFNIAMDPMDKLVTAGSAGTQLTWMDAKRDGVVFTPRFGKAVEINALWYSAMKLLSEHVRQRDPSAGANLNDLAEAVGRSFRKSFWNERAGCLFDCLSPTDDGGWKPAPEIRPNQLFAVSLPHSPLSEDQRASVLKVVREHLLTPMGVRTLARGDARYRGRYEGSLFDRDAAYHNGTAWAWLLGAYGESVLRVGGFSPEAKREARAALEPLLQMLVEPGAGSGVCAGQLAEIFDAEPEQRPQGCTAQAWSVAEILRVWLMTA